MLFLFLCCNHSVNGINKNKNNKIILVYKSGLVISREDPYLGASPDGKVIDKGCTQHFGLVEIKCPQTKFMVTPLEACSNPNFFLENLNGKPKLKPNHMYYKQVQGQLGITGTRWCDFVVYTCKGISIERITYDQQFWSDLKNTLISYYFKHFLPKAAAEFQRSQWDLIQIQILFLFIVNHLRIQI